jgi:hypothetical protein
MRIAGSACQEAIVRRATFDLESFAAGVGTEAAIWAKLGVVAA